MNYLCYETKLFKNTKLFWFPSSFLIYNGHEIPRLLSFVWSIGTHCYGFKATNVKVQTQWQNFQKNQMYQNLWRQKFFNFSISNEFNLLPKTLLLTFPDRKFQEENKSLPFLLSQIPIKTDLIIQWDTASSYPNICETSERYLTDVRSVFHITTTCFTSSGKLISVIYEKWSRVAGIKKILSVLNPISQLILNLSLRKARK